MEEARDPDSRRLSFGCCLPPGKEETRPEEGKRFFFLRMGTAQGNSEAHAPIFGDIRSRRFVA